MREPNEGARFLVHDISQLPRGAATSMTPRTDKENLGSPDAPNRTASE